MITITEVVCVSFVKNEEERKLDNKQAVQNHSQAAAAVKHANEAAGADGNGNGIGSKNDQVKQATPPPTAFEQVARLKVDI